MKLRSTGEAGVTARCDERTQAPAPAADPCAVVIFGATGDLAMRKLVPALYHLRGSRLLNERFTLIGVGRDGQTDTQYREKLSRDLHQFVAQPLDAGNPDWLLARASYVSGGLDDEATYRNIAERLTLGAGKPLTMDFCYVDHFGEAPSTGYETLLYDCMTGDATLFHRADIVEVGWELVAPVMAAWQADGPPVRNYAAGSWGPPEADALIARDGRAWRDPPA